MIDKKELGSMVFSFAYKHSGLWSEFFYHYPHEVAELGKPIPETFPSSEFLRWDEYPEDIHRVLMKAHSMGTKVIIHSELPADQAIPQDQIQGQIEDMFAAAKNIQGCSGTLWNQKQTQIAVEKLVVVDVVYHTRVGKEEAIGVGQIVIADRLAKDVRRAFLAAFDEGFFIQSTIPLAHPSYDLRDADGIPDDEKSMLANNSIGFRIDNSVFNGKLSLHTVGVAIDINPLQNRCERDGKALSPGEPYDPSIDGTLTKDSAFVRSLGDEWLWCASHEKGGTFHIIDDPMHSEAAKPQ